MHIKEMNQCRPKSLKKAYWLWLAGFFGCLGLHRFYLNKRKTAWLWVCSAGFLGIGALADLFTLPWLVRRHNLIERMKTLQLELKQATAWKERYVRAKRFEDVLAKKDKELLLIKEIRQLQEELQR